MIAKNQIRQIILNKKNSGDKLTAEEMQEALKYFSSEEIICMRFPIFDHNQCFRIPNKIENDVLKIKDEVKEESVKVVVEEKPPIRHPFVYGEFNP